MDSVSRALAGDQPQRSRAPSKGKRKAAARVNEDIDPPHGFRITSASK